MDLPSIAVVAYSDFPHLLKRCLQSILDHTPTGYQLILCLNQPGQESLDYAQSLSRQSLLDTLIVSRKNIGIEGAISLALNASRSRAMVRLDDDSYFMQDGVLVALSEEIAHLPVTWGALGRVCKGAPYADLPPGQGYVSRSWVRQQPWHRPEKDDILYQPRISVSGGFCVLNVKACLQVGYPSDEYGENGVYFFEEDAIMSLQLQMNGFTIHNSTLLSRMAIGAEVENSPANPMVAIGDALSRTPRDKGRTKWKDL